MPCSQVISNRNAKCLDNIDTVTAGRQAHAGIARGECYCVIAAGPCDFMSFVRLPRQETSSGLLLSGMPCTLGMLESASIEAKLIRF